MSRVIRIVVAGAVTALLASQYAFAQLGKVSAGPKAKVVLVSSVEAIVPKTPFDVAFHFQLAEGWHIYWQNSGDSGLPPNVEWSWPPGFSAGELQFPVPKRHKAPGNVVTNILPGEPVLPVRITPPSSLHVDNVKLTAEVRYLVCDDICLRESTTLTLELPVRPSGSEVKEANADLFRRARRALPKRTSKYLTLTASTQPSEPAPGEKFELVVDVAIKPGYHIQSHEPLNPSFIACDVFLERTSGVLFKSGIYPPPKFRELKYVGKVSEYTKRITIRVPGEVDGQAPAGPRRLGGLFKYQACNDKGTCFPPEALAFTTMTGSSTLGKAQTGGDIAPVVMVGSEQVQGIPAAPAQPVETVLSATTDDGEQRSFLERLGLPGLLLGCFLYGLFINATPCVLPLLSIKVLGFVQQAHESRSRTMMLGLTFGAGVILFFVALGFLASVGTNVLQFPAVVIALGAVVMALALSMLGVYTLQVPTAATKLEAAIQREGLLSSFGKGALAPVLGFACTGPLLAGAFGWATQQPPRIAVFAFVFAGVGMASPYMLLGANPQWLSFLPKPGNWMITFERIMGFLLLAMVIWLLHPLVTQMGAEGLEWTLGFLVAVGMGCWLLGQVDMNMSVGRRWRYRGGAGALVLAAGVLIYGWGYGRPAEEIVWERWSEVAVDEAVRSGQTVFVDFTAAYCTNCKVNKAVAINQPEVAQKIRDLGVRTFQGDFTSGDERIAAILRKPGRAGVPMDLIYSAGRPESPIVLTTLLSKQYLLKKLDEAGASRQDAVAGLGS